MRLVPFVTTACALLIGALSGPVALTAETLAPFDCRTTPRAEDEIWLISTRHLDDADCNATQSPALEVYRRTVDGGWESATLESLLSEAARLPTVIYSHGNRTESDSVHVQGGMYYDVLAGANPPPFRLVLWSWPSEQQLRGLRDLRLKAYRSDTEAWYLATVLAKWDPRATVSLVGYSYGARVATGALHLLAGGDANGRKLAAPPEDRLPISVVLVAPALHQDWLAPGATHGQAIERIDELLILFNPCDRALKRYHFVFRCEKPLALGAVGIAPQTFGDAAPRVRSINVSWQVGRIHDEPSYVAAPITVAELPAVLLGGAPSS